MSTPARLTGALAGRGTLERARDAGGRATVHLAVDLGHHRKGAIKVHRSDPAAAPGSERFFREIEVAANFTIPTSCRSTIQAMRTVFFSSSGVTSRPCQCSLGRSCRETGPCTLQ